MKRFLTLLLFLGLIICSMANGSLAVYTKTSDFTGTLTLLPGENPPVGGPSDYYPVHTGQNRVELGDDGTFTITGRGGAVLKEANPQAVPADGYQISVDVLPGEGLDRQEGLYFAGSYASYEPGLFFGYGLHFANQNANGAFAHQLTITKYEVRVKNGTENPAGIYELTPDYTEEYLALDLAAVKRAGYRLSVVVRPADPGLGLWVYLQSPGAGVEEDRLAAVIAAPGISYPAPAPTYIGVRADASPNALTVFQNLAIGPAELPEPALALLPPNAETTPEAVTLAVSIA